MLGVGITNDGEMSEGRARLPAPELEMSLPYEKFKKKRPRCSQEAFRLKF